MGYYYYVTVMFVHNYNACNYIHPSTVLPPSLHSSIHLLLLLPPSLPAFLPVHMHVSMHVATSQQCVYHGDNEYCTLSVVEKASSSCECCWMVDWTMQEWTPVLLLYSGVNQLMVHCKICVLFCDGIAILFYDQMHIEHHTWSRFALATWSIGNVWFSDHR